MSEDYCLSMINFQSELQDEDRRIRRVAVGQVGAQGGNDLPEDNLLTRGPLINGV